MSEKPRELKGNAPTVMSIPRQWFINGPKWIWQKRDWCNENQLDVDEQVHVIEYSAFEQLRAERDKYYKLFDTEARSTGGLCTQIDNLAKERDQLRSQLAVAREALEKIANHKQDSIDKVYLIHQCGRSEMVSQGNMVEHKTPIMEAIETLNKALLEDPQYYYAWQSNIAMPFQDCCARAGIKFPQLHEIANEAAKEFLTNLTRAK